MASAFGMLTAPRSFDFVRSLPSVLSSTSWKEVHEAIGMMRREGLNQLHAAGIPEELAKVSITVDVRHLGQGDTVTVSLGDSMAEDPKHEVEESFERSYIRLYGRRPPGVEPEILTWRVKVSGPDPTVSVQGIDASPQDPHTPEPRGSRLAWFVESDGFVETPVYDRYQLLPGQQVEGPALIEERESTAVLGPGCVARVSQVRALEVDVG